MERDVHRDALVVQRLRATACSASVELAPGFPIKEIPQGYYCNNTVRMSSHSQYTLWYYCNMLQ